MSESPFRIERLDHLVLRTKDLERMVAFYELLGGAVERRVEKLGMVQLRIGASMVDLVKADGADAAGDARNLDHFALRISPFVEEDILAFCRAHGIEAQTLPFPLLGADGYGPAVYIRDPDGNRVELKGPPNADPAASTPG
jgi:catechol 2,3-dioxygenase-like lactoylglutathione lyase family enzyme